MLTHSTSPSDGITPQSPDAQSIDSTHNLSFTQAVERVSRTADMRARVRI